MLSCRRLLVNNIQISAFAFHKLNLFLKLYHSRYAHIGSKSIKAQEYYVQQLTASLLRQFINWELWNSLPCRTLVSILSRKLTNYLLIYLSKPGFINYRLLKAVASKDHQDKLELNSYSFVSLSGCRELKKPIEKEGGLKIDQKLLADSIDGGNTPKETPKKSTKLVQLEVSLDEVDAPPVCSDTVVKDNEQVSVCTKCSVNLFV